MGLAKKELMEQEAATHRKESYLIDKVILNRCPRCETTFSPSSGSNFFCPNCQDDIDRQ